MTKQTEQGGVRGYLEARRLTIEGSIAAEVLAGNEWKEKCERTALAEIRAMQYALPDLENTRPDPQSRHSELAACPLEVIRTFMKPDGTLNLDQAATQELWDECQKVEDVYYERDEARATIATMQRTQCADCVTIGKLQKRIEQIHIDLGHEMRDPNGTIWQEADRLQAENKRLRVDLRKQMSDYLEAVHDVRAKNEVERERLRERGGEKGESK